MTLYNLEMEQHILGCIMIDPNYCLPITIAEMKSEDFYEDRNRDIFDIMISLFKSGTVIDALMIKAKNETVTVSYISALADGVASVKYIRDYISEVKKLAQRRSVMNQIGILKQSLIDGMDAESELDKFLSTVSNIKENSKEGVTHIKDVLQTVYEKIKKGKEYGFRTGFECLDRYEKGLHRGRLYILATGTGRGKTAFVSNMVVNSISYEKTVLFLSVEMTVEEIVSRLIAIATETPNKYSDEYVENTPMWDEQSKKEMLRNRLQGIGRLSDSDIYIDDRPKDMLGILSVARDMKYKLERKGKTLDILVVDYLQLIQPTSNSKTFTREQEVGAIADGLKLIAKTLDVPVLALAQTNRLAEKEGREYTVGDLRESARIEQNADMILFLNRDEDDKSKFSLVCAKNRHGSTFKQNLNFESDILKFTETENTNDKN